MKMNDGIRIRVTFSTNTTACASRNCSRMRAWSEGRGGPDGTVQNILDRGTVRAVEILRDNHEFVRLTDHAADLLKLVLHEALRRMFGPEAEAALARRLISICCEYSTVSCAFKVVCN